jgi:hypothetical protein
MKEVKVLKENEIVKVGDEYFIVKIMHTGNEFAKFDRPYFKKYLSKEKIEAMKFLAEMGVV